ncbi:hypothetical protein [Bartonella tamiae]|uniref:Uncharacterized protein n=1 Tax=Bartonella tamiae Th239 TaxID=1094558 RepID=J0QYF5_9HYPH|nr:hypothetical protein [Bartonella tamiae]EJF91146.1 hypothetical protein ME5_00478 [Bartonella tamiae Th239]EJF93189.1 hypothetical protein MEG_01403 [Bartonella tamiae Th307]
MQRFTKDREDDIKYTSNTSEKERVWNLIKKIQFCMFTTKHGESIHALPKAAHIDEDSWRFFF